MDRDTLLLAVSILLLIAFDLYTVITGGSPNSAIFSLPLVSILATFLLFLYLLLKAEKRLNQSLESRLPPITFLESKNEVEAELTRLAEQASEFIVSTGGRAHNQKYLKIIEQRVISTDLAYWRLILDEPITHEICQHLCSLLEQPNVIIGRIKDNGYSNMLLADKGVIIALPTPGKGG